MTAPRVLLYATAWCGYCARARGLLADKGVAFEEIDVDLVPGALAEMLARSGGAISVPQIFVGATHVGGCDELVALEGEGKLDSLLKNGA